VPHPRRILGHPVGHRGSPISLPPWALGAPSLGFTPLLRNRATTALGEPGDHRGEPISATEESSDLRPPGHAWPLKRSALIIRLRTMRALQQKVRSRPADQSCARNPEVAGPHSPRRARRTTGAKGVVWSGPRPEMCSGYPLGAAREPRRERLARPLRCRCCFLNAPPPTGRVARRRRSLTFGHARASEQMAGK
jgi:hypothetical protein